MIYFGPNDCPKMSEVKKILKKRLLIVPRFHSRVTQDSSKTVYFEEIPVEKIDWDYHLNELDGEGTFDIESMNEFMTKLYVTDMKPGTFISFDFII